MLAALTIDRPLLYRMAGASRLTLYPVGAAQKHTLSVCLSKADAEAVADQLMPLVKPTLHRPAGGERAALGFLGANGLSTLALFVLAVSGTRPTRSAAGAAGWGTSSAGCGQARSALQMSASPPPPG